MKIDETHLIGAFRDAKLIGDLASQIANEAQNCKQINIMEVCGGHTHAIMQYGLHLLLPKNIEFIHGPGCPVCVMPKERIDHAYILAQNPDVILLTLGDMIKVPASCGSLADARSAGADVRFLYSPFEALKIAQENPSKTVIFFAIGFETTTPMTASLIDQTIKMGIKNLLFHINHVTVPEAVSALLSSASNRVNAIIAPAHVSVITGSKIYAPLTDQFKLPIVVSGFEPVDIMQSVLMIVRQFARGEAKLENEYSRSVTISGNTKAQELVNRYFVATDFKWRGLGVIPQSALKLRDEFAHIDAQKHFELPAKEVSDHKACICGEILRGAAKPVDCKLFKTACTPQNPYGSCMVSSEGACAAYYKYGDSQLCESI